MGLQRFFIDLMEKKRRRPNPISFLKNSWRTIIIKVIFNLYPTVIVNEVKSIHTSTQLSWFNLICLGSQIQQERELSICITAYRYALIFSLGLYVGSLLCLTIRRYQFHAMQKTTSVWYVTFISSTSVWDTVISCTFSWWYNRYCDARSHV